MQLKGCSSQVRFEHLATLVKNLLILRYDQAKNDKNFRASLGAEGATGSSSWEQVILEQAVNRSVDD